MSRRSSKAGSAATSRRTRRGKQLQPPAFAATATVVSNPIFLCEDGSARGLIKRARARGRDVPDDGGGKLLPLPLPPNRAHREGRGVTRVPAWHDGPTIVVGPHGAVLRTCAPPPQQHDPFLAAYVVCTKGRAGAGAGTNSRQAKKKKKAKLGMRGGCGMWNGWASGAAGVMSCRHNSAVTVLQGATPLPAARGAGAGTAESPAHPTLDLSRLPAVLPGRRRPQS